MRNWPVFLLLLSTSVAGCLDSLPETPDDGGDQTVAPAPTGLGPGNGTLYLHAADGELWMDTEGDGGETLSGTHTAATPAPTFRFRLRPSPERDVLVESLSVHLETTASGIVGDSPVHVVALVVAGKEVDRQTGSNELTLAGGDPWPADADVELHVCVCPRPTSVTYGYTLAADGGSLATLSFSGTPAEPGGTGTGGEGTSGSSGVTVTRQGDHWLAQRTDAYKESTTATRADVRLYTAVGGVTVQHGQGSDLTIALSATGETEQEARDRLEAMMVEYAATGGATFTLDAGVRVPDGNWTGRSAVLTLGLGPRELSALDVDTSTADVDVGAFTGGTWNIDSSTGEVTARGIDVDRVDVHTSTGDVLLDGAIGSLQVDTSTGSLDLTGTVDTLQVDASTGDVDADVRATASGSWSISTSTGRIDLRVPEEATRGYDATADTSTGDITFTFQDASPVGEQEDEHKHVRTNGYDGRGIKTLIELDTSTADIRAGP